MALCEMCGLNNAQEHHIVPKELHGQDGRQNYAYLCWEHHMKLHSRAEKMINEYKNAIGRKLTLEEKRSCYIKAYILMKNSL